MISLARWQQAMRPPHEAAQQLRANGRFRDGDLIDETLVRAFFALTPDLSDEKGWMLATRALLDLDTPLAIDQTADPEFTVPAARVTAMLAVPDLLALGTAEEIARVLGDAILRGVPAYNEGNSRACGIVYWATALTVISATPLRGFTGQMRALKALRAAVEEAIPPIGRDRQGQDDFAWRMRRALDAALEAVRG